MTASIRWVPVGIEAHAIRLAQVTFLALIRVDNVVATVVGLEASKRASVGTEVGAIQLAEVALFWAVDHAIPAESPPRASCRTPAIRVVVVRPRATPWDRNRSITAVTLFSRFDNAITTLTTLVTVPVADHTSVEAGYHNSGCKASPARYTATRIQSSGSLPSSTIYESGVIQNNMASPGA